MRKVRLKHVCISPVVEFVLATDLPLSYGIEYLQSPNNSKKNLLNPIKNIKSRININKKCTGYLISFWCRLPVLWIRNDLVRMRILLFRSLWIRIPPFKPGQINKWQISNKRNDTADRLLKHFKDFLRKYVVQQSKKNRKEEKLAKITRIFLSQRPDRIRICIRIQIRPGQKAQIRLDPNPQHCGLPSPEKLKKNKGNPSESIKQ